MLTDTQARRLRGLITHHARSEFDRAHAGAQPPEDAKIIREEAEKARIAVFAEIRKLTEKAK